MLLQIIRCEIDPAEIDDVRRVLTQAAAALAGSPGLLRAELLRSIDAPERVAILLACTDQDALREVNQSPPMQTARAALARLLTAPFSIEQHQAESLLGG